VKRVRDGDGTTGEEEKPWYAIATVLAGAGSPLSM
jgi:hypothetical protein